MRNQQPQEARQAGDNLHVLGANLLGAFTAPFRVLASADGNYAVALIGLIALPLIPAFMVGSLIKTVVDINTRPKLTLGEVAEMALDIEQLDDEHFDRLVSQIISHPVQSQSSQELQITLGEGAQASQEKALATFKVQKTREIKNQAIANAKTKLGDSAARLNINIDGPLSEEENREIDTACLAKKLELTNEQRKAHRAKIISYTNDPINAGKNLQRFIQAQIAQLKAPAEESQHEDNSSTPRPGRS